MANQTQAKIPVVDFSNADLKPGSSSWSSMRRDVCRALEEYGCFVAELGNKVPLKLHNTTFGAMRELFDFPTETKKKLPSERPGHGYFSKAFYERLAIDNGNSPEETQKLTNIFWPNGNVHFRPGNANYLEQPYDICDPYSNSQAQELVQILPHPEWVVHGYPEKQGDGWVGDSRTWVLDVGALSSRLYFYQDPGIEPARRVWSSINVGTEIYVSSTGMTAEWSVNDFDILVLEDVASSGVSFD